MLKILNEDKVLDVLKQYKDGGNYIKSDKEATELLKQVIDKYGTVTGNVTLYRNEELQKMFGLSSRSEWYDNPEEFEKFIIGKVITPGGFLSTSKHPLGMIFNGIEIKFTNVKNTKGLDLSTIKLNVNVYDREEEVLFNVGTSYKINKVVYHNYHNGKDYYSLEEYKNYFKEKDRYYDRFVLKLEGEIIGN